MSVSVDKQKHNSDIDILITTKTNGKHLILIEDKTTSKIHPSNKKGSKSDKYVTQLEKYYDEFSTDREYKELFLSGKIHLFYYKNDYLDENEKELINQSNSLCKAIFLNRVNEFSLKRKKKKEITIVDIERNYTWNILNIEEILKIFKNFKESFDNVILSDYYECLIYKKKLLDVSTYPLYITGYNDLSENHKNVAWFSYLRNCIWKKMKIFVEENEGYIGEPYWHQGGDDINIAIWVKKEDLPHLRIMTSKIRDPKKIVIQVAIYSEIAEKTDSNGKKDNRYYQDNIDQTNAIMEELQNLYDTDSNEYLLKKDDSKPPKGEKKTIGTTDEISILDKENKDDALIEIIKKCWIELAKISEEIRKIRI